MTPVTSLAYSISLFLALVFLLSWRYRRQNSAHRVRRGLRVYAAGEQMPDRPCPSDSTEEHAQELVVQE